MFVICARVQHLSSPSKKKCMKKSKPLTSKQLKEKSKKDRLKDSNKSKYKSRNSLKININLSVRKLAKRLSRYKKLKRIANNLLEKMLKNKK